MPGFPAFMRQRLGWLASRTFAYDTVRRIHPWKPLYLLTHPEDVRHVLLRAADQFSNGADRSSLMRLQACLARNSRLTVAAEEADLWVGSRQAGTTFNAATEMPLLALRIFLRSWFGGCPEHQQKQWVHALDLRQMAIEKRFAERFPAAERWPDWELPECERADVVIRDFLRENVESRRGRPQDDLLSGLLAQFAHNEEAENQLLALSTAGHEPAGTTLAFCLHLLGHHPEWQRRARESAEIREQVLAETLRLYPPYWMLVRRALRATELPSGMRVRPEDLLLISPFLLHRHPQSFAEPERFRPERFGEATLPAGYVPYLGCPAERLAGEQISRVLEALLLRFRWRSLSLPELPLEGGTVLRPACPVTIHLDS